MGEYIGSSCSNHETNNQNFTYGKQPDSNKQFSQTKRVQSAIRRNTKDRMDRTQLLNYNINSMNNENNLEQYKNNIVNKMFINDKSKLNLSGPISTTCFSSNLKNKENRESGALSKNTNSSKFLLGNLLLKTTTAAISPMVISQLNST